MQAKKSLFIQTLSVLILSAGVFYVLKTYVPKDIISFKAPKVAETTDSLLLKAMQSRDSVIAIPEEPLVTAPVDTVKKEEEKKVFTPSFSPLAATATPDSVIAPLQYFFSALAQLETTGKGNVRMAYFGDSMIDGDLIVQTLRWLFQQKYGGSGVGFIPMTSESARSRITVKHRFSDNWRSVSYLSGKRPEKPYGISGEVFFTADSLISSTTFRRGYYAHQYIPLHHPVLYFGRDTSAADSAKVRLVINKDTTYKKLQPHKWLNKLKLTKGNVEKLKIDFINTDSIPFYGISSTGANGVYIDKFSSRGNSGLPLSIVSSKMLQLFNNEFHYDLIILHFGTNVLNSKVKHYGWYGNRMARVIEHLKKSFPKTSFLVISMADKATKYGVEMKTDSAVVPLVRAQQAYAHKENAGFINLYALMGGRGAMVHYVEGDTAMANKDYTHFNSKGARKIGHLLFKNIEREYEKFKAETQNDSL